MPAQLSSDTKSVTFSSDLYPLLYFMYESCEGPGEMGRVV